ncbi:MAG: sulfurtransferase TusA family protein [Proteobacteria bacterium]|nr:sulfurtransferase TusA family protein [Pseudomonadota bacterium]MBU1708431.1 sulfurtransferase TusA family protein [Pseudomonadota bacterium]
MAMKFDKISDGVYELDVCGFVCPHPQLYCKKSLQKIESGDTLKLIFDNASSGETIRQMLDQQGDEITAETTEGGKLVWMIEKG